MSRHHPIISITGSSGAGTTTIKNAFANLLHQQNIQAAFIDGDSFHRYTRDELKKLYECQPGKRQLLSHFALEANLLAELNQLFSDYANHGTGQYRQYVHAEDKYLIESGYAVGTFTPWTEIEPNTDLLIYEGLHGGLITPEFNLAQYADLLIGVAPSINLEWMQKINRDTKLRGYSQEAVIDTIHSRMEDYARNILPQFSRTHINFQRIPTVDTSNPFEENCSIPSPEESLVIIRFREQPSPNIDYLISQISGSFKSRPCTLVVPGAQMQQTLELIMLPKLQKLIAARKFK